MTVDQAHILFDSLLGEINKEIEMNFIPEVKDMYLNAAALEHLSDMAGQERDRVRNLITYSNIGSYYTSLAPFLSEIKIPLTDGDGRYNTGDLPSPSTSLISKGLYRNKATYVLNNEAAGYDFSNLTSDLNENSEIGSSFTINVDNIIVNSSNQYNERSSNNKIKEGEIYKIVKVSGIDLKKYGAVSNNEGTLFICSKTQDLSLFTNINLDLEVYAAKPIKLGSPKLQSSPIISNDYAEPISLSATVGIKNKFSSGSIIKGKRYVIITTGQTNLENFGVKVQVQNSVFISTASGEPIWGSNPTVLQEVSIKGCELIKPVDLEDKLVHSFGTSVNRPISTIIGNKARVYHMGNFNVINLSLTYVRVPNTINYLAGGSLEFNALEQNKIVQRAVRLAASTIPSNNYNTLRAETSEVKSQPQQTSRQ